MSEKNMQMVRRLLEEVWTRGNLSLLPDLMGFTIEDQFDSENKVATRWTTRVSDESGDARQDAHTSEELTIDGTTITHHDPGGKIIAEWATWDTGSLLQSAAAPRIIEQLSIKA